MPEKEQKNRQETRKRCVLCGEIIDVEQGYYRLRGQDFCNCCLDFSDTETIIRICEIPKRIWFEKMGFEYVGNAKIGRIAYGK